MLLAEIVTCPVLDKGFTYEKELLLIFWHVGKEQLESLFTGLSNFNQSIR